MRLYGARAYACKRTAVGCVDVNFDEVGYVCEVCEVSVRVLVLVLIWGHSLTHRRMSSVDMDAQDVRGRGSERRDGTGLSW